MAAPRSWLTVLALVELVRFDVLHALFGFARAHRGIAAAGGGALASSGRVPAICDAIALASALYWKPVLCLQRSVAAARLMRRYGIPARLVVGYRAVPFIAHAWVEVYGRIVNDSPAFAKQLTSLYTA